MYSLMSCWFEWSSTSKILAIIFFFHSTWVAIGWLCNFSKVVSRSCIILRGRCFEDGVVRLCALLPLTKVVFGDEDDLVTLPRILVASFIDLRTRGTGSTLAISSTWVRIVQ